MHLPHPCNAFQLNPEHASLLGCAITTAFGVVENNACLKMGESVVVYGAGGIGLSIIQAAKSVSAWPIIAVDIFEKRLELAKQIGATHAINGLENDPKVLIKSILQNQELDVFIDNTGIPNVIEKGYSIIKSDGRLILVGVPKRDKNINLLSTLSIRSTELACVKSCFDILLNTGVNSFNSLFKVFAPI